jgi:hypothetical protein
MRLPVSDLFEARTGIEATEILDVSGDDGVTMLPGN